MTRGRAGLGTIGVCLVTLGGCALGLSACSSSHKKLSTGGGPGETILYDVLGYERDPGYYYKVVQDSHKPEDFCYRCGEDPFVVDKSIDAVQHLGRASYGRLEGQAQTIVVLEEILVEDRSPLARASAANSLTQIGVRLPRYPSRPVPDSGERFLALAQELRALYGGGRGRPCDAASKARAIEVLTQLGDLKAPDLTETKKWIKEFYGRDYLIDERDPQLRAAIDTALVKRSDAVLRLALRFAVEDPAPEVRSDAVKGLKTLADVESEDAVIDRLDRETHWVVRLEIAEYLGRIGTPKAVAALVPLVEDPDAAMRHKARGALARVAGQDLGIRRMAWASWARSRYPGVELPEDEAARAKGALAAGRPAK